MTWRVARSLEVLLAQFDAASPGRSRASDGAIGNAAHVAEGWTNSDHNPWYPLPNGGIVTARDFTHDPAHGMDIAAIADQLAASRDPRIKYVIANRRILDSRAGNNPWRWMPYSGPSPHTEHVHLSVMNNPSCDDLRPWRLPLFHNVPAPTPTPGGFLMALTDAEQVEILAGIRALKPGMVLPARSVNCRTSKDDQYGHTLNAEAEAADARAVATQALAEIRALRAVLGK